MKLLGIALLGLVIHSAMAVGSESQLEYTDLHVVSSHRATFSVGLTLAGPGHYVRLGCAETAQPNTILFIQQLSRQAEYADGASKLTGNHEIFRIHDFYCQALAKLAQEAKELGPDHLKLRLTYTLSASENSGISYEQMEIKKLAIVGEKGEYVYGSKGSIVEAPFVSFESAK